MTYTADQLKTMNLGPELTAKLQQLTPEGREVFYRLAERALQQPSMANVADAVVALDKIARKQ